MFAQDTNSLRILPIPWFFSPLAPCDVEPGPPHQERWARLLQCCSQWTSASVRFSRRWFVSRTLGLSRGAILEMSKAVFVYRRRLFALIRARKRCAGWHLVYAPAQCVCVGWMQFPWQPAVVEGGRALEPDIPRMCRRVLYQATFTFASFNLRDNPVSGTSVFSCRNVMPCPQLLKQIRLLQ